MLPEPVGSVPRKITRLAKASFVLAANEKFPAKRATMSPNNARIGLDTFNRCNPKSHSGKIANESRGEKVGQRNEWQSEVQSLITKSRNTQCEVRNDRVLSPHKNCVEERRRRWNECERGDNCACRLSDDERELWRSPK